MKHDVVKVCLDNNWAYIKVYPGQTLKDILPQLYKKYPKVGYLQPKDYEFHIAVQIDEDIRMDECILDMDLPVETLGAKELRL
mmetsp:Transcript_28846/g.5219  ORF Transcript_28846/g.5219 Transcript_28846/m.5219 type:complete len:83 (-) Transcript_28846:495-743(-)